MILAELDQKIRAFLEIQICPNLSIFRNWGTPKKFGFFSYHHKNYHSAKIYQNW